MSISLCFLNLNLTKILFFIRPILLIKLTSFQAPLKVYVVSLSNTVSFYIVKYFFSHISHLFLVNWKRWSSFELWEKLRYNFIISFSVLLSTFHSSFMTYEKPISSYFEDIRQSCKILEDITLSPILDDVDIYTGENI